MNKIKAIRRLGLYFALFLLGVLVGNAVSSVLIYLTVLLLIVWLLTYDMAVTEYQNRSKRNGL